MISVRWQEKRTAVIYFATDRNKDAAATTSTTMKNHGFEAEVREREQVWICLGAWTIAAAYLRVSVVTMPHSTTCSL